MLLFHPRLICVEAAGSDSQDIPAPGRFVGVLEGDLIPDGDARRDPAGRKRLSDRRSACSSIVMAIMVGNVRTAGTRVSGPAVHRLRRLRNQRLNEAFTSVGSAEVIPRRRG